MKEVVKIPKVPRDKPTLGQRAADRLTKIAGSWSFIILFLLFLFVWMGINVYAASTSRWDEYPFILLNLCLSCLAAIQAPIILMSQNRSAQKDRKREEYDYAINRRSERQIENVLKKLDSIEKRLKK